MMHACLTTRPSPRRLMGWGLLLVFATLNPGETMAAINGVLRTNTAPGANTRYFTDDSGKPVYLTGTHTWPNLVDGWLIGHDDPAPPFDWNGYLAYVVAQNQNFIRLWSQELPKTDFTNPAGGTPNPVTRMYYPTPNPWQRTGPGTAADGKPKFDLTQLNQAYFDRLQQRVADAHSNGVYVGIMLFEGFGTRVKTGALGWNYSPFHSNNNINGINGDPNGNGCGIEAHSLQIPAITAIQKAYINKVIDTVNAYDNVLYEISNEEWNNSSSGYPSIAWQTELMNHIRTYEAGKPKQHPVIISCIYNDAQNGGENGLLNASTADAIAPYGATTLKNNPPATAGGVGDKVVFADTDHIWGLGGGADWVWKVFTRGYNPLFMDGWVNNGWIGTAWYDAATYDRDGANAAMGATLAYARRMNLAEMPPQNALASTTYCLAKAGVEYLVYQPVAGNVTLYGLPAGTYTCEWTRPDTGAFHSASNRVLSAGDGTFTPPFAPAVLYVKVVATNQVATPAIAPHGGSFLGSASVLLTCDTGAASIRYTLDGSEPTTNAALYSGAITLAQSATLKAKAFKNGLLDSNTIGANFIRLSGSGPIIDDEFNDADTGANTGGTGSGWNRGSFNGAPLPGESNGTFNASMGTENGVGAIHGKDTFTFWDENGLTATWVIRDIAVQTPHLFNGYLAYCWEMGIISANADKSGSTWNMSQVNRKGGFYVSVGKKDNSNTVELWVFVSNKLHDGTHTSTKWIRLPAQSGSVLGPRWTATFPLTVTATLTSNGWSVSAGGLATPMTGNWTTSLTRGVTNASITDEFVNGAFLFTAGRNHGIDGSGNTFAPNSGALERVMAMRHAGDTVAAPVFTPGGNTYFAPTEVTITSSPLDALIRYTLDGTDPTTNSGVLYTNPVPIAASATLSAIAYQNGMTPSPVTRASYILLNGPAADTLVNGSFEAGTNGWTVLASDANVPAYSILTNQGTRAGIWALALGPANAAGNAVFIQKVRTVPGTNTTLRLDYGGFGASGKLQQLLVELLASGTVFTSRVVTAYGPGNFLPGNTTFQTHALDFTAPSTSVVIRLTDQTTSLNSSQCDGMLDNVSLTQTGIAPPLIKLACIGDSITEGAYPGLLQTQLGAAYLVENDGVGGRTMIKNDPFSYWTGGKLPQVAALQPDLVTIMLGTNDAKVQNWASRRAEFKTDYLAMIDWLQALASRPRVFPVLPVPAWTNMYGINTNTMPDLVTIIREIAEERNLPLIDANTPFLGSSAQFPDGVHPNDAAAAELAEIFEAALLADQATPVVAWPTISPAAGTYQNPQVVTLSTATDGAGIRYTIDGSTPTADSGLIYSTAVQVAVSTEIRALAHKSGMQSSPVTVATFEIEPQPRVGLRNGSFEEGTNGWTVLTSSANPAAYGVIDYQGRTDGVLALSLGGQDAAGNAIFAQTLTTATGFLYTVHFDYGAFGLTAKQQRLLVEVREGENAVASLLATATGTGDFLPENTTFQTRTLVFTPTTTSVELRFTDQTTLANSFSCDGMLDDVKVTGGGTVATPVFSRPSGTYAYPCRVEITTETEGASVRYTLDGSTPTAEHGTPYTGPFYLHAPANLRAMAYRVGYNDSAVATASYRLVGDGLLMIVR